MEYLIEIKNLKKEYKVTDIFQWLKGERVSVGVNDVSFEVTEGEIYAIIGVNGAGKTTIMKCILGLLPPDRGTIKVFGKDKIDRKDFYKIGYLPEISYYPKEVKLKDIMNFYADLYDMSKEKRRKAVPEILEVLKLNGRENDRLEKFSKGMLQRVGIAQAIMNEPKLLFLDEPMSGLDPLGQKMVCDLIRNLKSGGTTVFLNTHILSDVEKLADKITLVDKGRVKSTINFKEYFKNTTKYIIQIDKKNDNAILQDGKFYLANVKESELGNTISDLVKRSIKILEITKEEMTLEKYFLSEVS